MTISFDNLEELDNSNKLKLTSRLLDVARITETVDPDLIASCLNQYLPYSDNSKKSAIADAFTQKALSSAVYRYTEQENIPFLDDLIRDKKRLSKGAIFKINSIFDGGTSVDFTKDAAYHPNLETALYDGGLLVIYVDPPLIVTRENYRRLTGTNEFLIVAELGGLGESDCFTAFPLLIASCRSIRPNQKNRLLSINKNSVKANTKKAARIKNAPYRACKRYAQDLYLNGEFKNKKAAAREIMADVAAFAIEKYRLTLTETNLENLIYGYLLNIKKT